MKRLIALPFLCSFMMLCGCNGVGDKDTLLARINDEKVYQEDENILLKSMQGAKNMTRKALLYEHVLGKAALVSRALSEFPELEAEWDQYYKDIDVRILMMLFQRVYVMECLTYTDEELKAFYEANRDLFAKDSVVAYDRTPISNEYYVYKNPEQWKEYLAKSANPEDTASLDTAALKVSFADQRRNELRELETANVLSDSQVVVNPLPEVPSRFYYDKHKGAFKTAPGYELYQVQMADSAKLARLIKDSVSLDEFKAIAAKMDKNEFTAKDSGRVGVVKEGYSLPYGLGVMSELDEVLKDKQPGFVTPVIRSAAQGTFHRFYLVRQVPAEQKSYERAEQDAKMLASSGELPDVDSSYVLVTYAGKPVFTFGDYLRFNEKYFRAPKNMRAYQYVVDNFAESYRFAVAAKAHKLDHLWEYRALVRDTRADFIIEKYLDKKIAVTADEDTLKALFDRIGSPIRYNLTYEQAKSDLLHILSYPMNLYKHEYYMGYRVTYAGKTFDESIPSTFAKRANEYRTWMKMRWMDEAYASAVRHIYDSSVKEHEQEYDPALLMAKADSLYKAGNRTAAYNTYRKVMNAYADNDSLYQVAAYEIAQVQNDNEEFDDAEAEFYAFYSMWPQNPNAEKAMFTRGFILDENLKRDSLALEVLEGFQKLYPNSELKESVDWLVNNIKSGGKLADDLMKKIEAEE